MKVTIAILVVLGLVAAMCTVMLVNVIPDILAKEQDKKNEISVFVAARNIPAHTELAKEDVVLKTIDLAKEGGYYANPGIYLTELINVVGKTVSEDIPVETPITRDKIITDLDLATILKALKPGMRAYPVRLSDDQIVGGLLFPGCFVDVLVASSTPQGRGGTKGEAVSKTFLERVKVIAVKGELSSPNQTEEGKTSSGRARGSGGWTVTLLVDTAQAEALQLATSKGEISLTLRNPLDADPVLSKGTVWDPSKIGVFGGFFDSSLEKSASSDNSVSSISVQVIKGPKVSYEEVQESGNTEESPATAQEP